MMDLTVLRFTEAIAQALLPQVQAAAAAALSANPALKPIVTALNTSGAAANALNVIQTQYPSLDLSGLTGVPAAGLPRVNTGGAKFVAPAPSTGPRPKCRIPNCKEIVYVDNEGVYGEFCSQLCRECVYISLRGLSGLLTASTFPTERRSTRTSYLRASCA